MARTRLIKPDFFMNEELAECSAHARLLFIGLWTLADREGRLRNAPAWISGNVFPHESVNVPKLLSELAKREFIRTYEVDGRSYIDLPTFTKHQNIHHRESESNLPAYTVNSLGKAQPRKSLGKASAKPGQSLGHSDIDSDSDKDSDSDSVSCESSDSREKKTRPPDPIWDQLCKTFGLKPVTKSECRFLGSIVRDLKLKRATPEEIVARRVVYGRIFNGVVCTPKALLTHWDQLGMETRPKGPSFLERYGEKD